MAGKPSEPVLTSIEGGRSKEALRARVTDLVANLLDDLLLEEVQAEAMAVVILGPDGITVDHTGATLKLLGAVEVLRASIVEELLDG